MTVMHICTWPWVMLRTTQPLPMISLVTPRCCHDGHAAQLSRWPRVAAHPVHVPSLSHARFTFANDHTLCSVLPGRIPSGSTLAGRPSSAPDNPPISEQALAGISRPIWAISRVVQAVVQRWHARRQPTACLVQTPKAP